MRAAASYRADPAGNLPGRAGAERADPPPPLFLIQGGKLDLPADEAPEETVLDVSKPELSASPTEGLAEAKAPAAGRSRKWLAAIAASCVFHVAVAALFLEFRDDLVQLAGADQSGVVMAGNGAEDQLAAGDLEPATNVTLIPMIRAETVETNEAEPIQPAQTVTEAEAAEVPVTERLAAVEEQPVEPVQPLEPLPEPEPEQAVQPALEAPLETTEPVQEAPQAAPVAEAPPVLATDQVEPVEDDNVVPPVAEQVVPQAPVEEPAVAPVPEEDQEVAEIAEQLARLDSLPVPAPRPSPPKPEPEQPKAAPAKKPAPEKQQAARTSGSGGKNQADARRGAADGKTEGNTAVASRGSRQNTAAGNAAVSNYPGKIVSKLRRALRYPAAAKRQRLRGEVHVAFTVSGNGSVGAVRVVRSSGADILDKAAIETVRRAAPFPPIPAEAGRSSWPFTVPLAFTR